MILYVLKYVSKLPSLYQLFNLKCLFIFSFCSDVLRAMSEVSKNSCKFVGLENMSSYVMLDNRIRILPFNIRRGSADKDADIADQLLAFSGLLLKKLYPKWKDVDLMEFISLMHEPDTT